MNTWYKDLNRAPWSPPNYVFGIIWPILYLLMTISVLLVIFNKKCYPYCRPITFFILQLILNLSWTTVFFQLQQPLIALIMIVFIIGITAYTALKFYPYSKIASLLLVPYLLWLCVAFSLNGYIVLYN
jgi:tryptophan-rich sensory protein